MKDETFYNEIDPNAAEWLRNLGVTGQITPGAVNERSIKEISGADLAGVRRAHFFAGIGGWDLALRLAGWPDDQEVWTGSCPCQPYSSAGKQEGDTDARNLWPYFFRLIRERRPGAIFGEQVASAIRHGWLDRVFTDLEGIGYACGAAVLGAHSVGAPHIRQRLYWVADRLHPERRPLDGAGKNGCDRADGGRQETHGQLGTCGEIRGMGDADGCSLGTIGVEAGSDLVEAKPRRAGPCGDGDLGGVEHTDNHRLLPRWLHARSGELGEEEALEPGIGSWSDFRIVLCTDGKARRTGTGVFPLAHGLSRGVGVNGTELGRLARRASRARIGMLKGSGNAIVPELAAEFVMAYLETR